MRDRPNRLQSQPKPEYRRWIEIRAEMDRLRQHYSWTQISKMAGKGNNGWAASAYKQRGLTVDSDLTTLRSIETPKEAPVAKVEIGRPCTENENTEFRSFVGWLEGDQKWTRERVARAAGYSAGSGIRMATKPGGSTSVKRLEALRATIERQWGTEKLMELQAAAFQGWNAEDDKAEEQDAQEAKGEAPRCTATAEFHGVDRRCGRVRHHDGDHQFASSAGLVELPRNSDRVEEDEFGRQLKERDDAAPPAPKWLDEEDDPWAWMDEVAEGLLALALRVDEQEVTFLATVPESFRASMGHPFAAKREAIERAMVEFQR